VAFQYVTVNSNGMSTHYHARSLIFEKHFFGNASFLCDKDDERPPSLPWRHSTANVHRAAVPRDVRIASDGAQSAHPIVCLTKRRKQNISPLKTIIRQVLRGPLPGTSSRFRTRCFPGRI